MGVPIFTAHPITLGVTKVGSPKSSACANQSRLLTLAQSLTDPNNTTRRREKLKGHPICSYGGWKKSCTTLDGWNPINSGINYLWTGAGFLPSTVCSFCEKHQHTLFLSSTDCLKNCPLNQWQLRYQVIVFGYCSACGGWVWLGAIRTTNDENYLAHFGG